MDHTQAAADLGMDHAEATNNGEAVPKIYSGRQVALALGISEDLTGAEYLALRDAYQGGQSSYF